MESIVSLSSTPLEPAAKPSALSRACTPRTSVSGGMPPKFSSKTSGSAAPSEGSSRRARFALFGTRSSSAPLALVVPWTRLPSTSSV